MENLPGCEPDGISDEAARLGSALLGKASHDLRSPLGSILMWARVLRLADPTGSDAASARDMIERSAADAVAELDAIEDLRRALTGDVPPGHEPVDLPALLLASVATANEEASLRGVSIDLLPSAPIGAIVANPRRLRLALDHVLGGLLREAPRGASIAVRVDVVDGEARCEFALASNELAAPARADLRARLAHRLIELQGGELRRERGHGTTVSIRLKVVTSRGIR